MLRVTVLGSGSRGNAMLVDGTEGALLVDAGFGARSLAKRLAVAGRRPEEIGAVLLTHEHTDHASGAIAARSRWGWLGYASAGTIAGLDLGRDAPEVVRPADWRAFIDTGATAVGGFSIETTAVPHDARDCRALVITDDRSGARVGIAMDLGHVPDTLPVAFGRLDLLVVEANHDEQMLAGGPYPWSLKQRISGGLGHLSNGAAAAFASSCVHPGLRGVLLTHLSETNNTPAMALARTREALRRAGWTRDVLYAASQQVPLPPVSAGGETGWPVAQQLGLAL